MHSALHDFIVLTPFFILLICSIILSFKTRFVQIRAFKSVFSLLYKSLTSSSTESTNTIPAHRALFSAMATTIGISNITGPLIAIGMSGPSALIGYFLATLFGSAATFTEVTFALRFKDPAPREERIGGPMFYLNQVFPRWVSVIYALGGAILILMWSGAQSVALATILSPYGVPQLTTGIVTALLTIVIITGGIKRFGQFSTALVPGMFIMYITAILWIICLNITRVPHAFSLIINDVFSPEGLKGAFVGYSIAKALRWGLAKGYSANEAGVGTGTVSHSFAETDNALSQGLIAIVSVFSSGLLCISTGIAILVTDTYLLYGNDNISLITGLFADYFPVVGPIILVASATLFVLTTVVGNSYNGSQFYMYVWGKKGLWIYHTLCVLSIVICSVSSVNFIWAYEDFFTIPVIIPHAIGLILLAYKFPALLELSKSHLKSE